MSHVNYFYGALLSFLELGSSCSLYVFAVRRKKKLREHSSKHFYL